MSTAHKIRFADFTHLLLARLYELDEAHPGESFNLNEIAREIGAHAPDIWVLDAAQLLQARRLATCAYTFGAVYGQLTRQGRAFVQEEKGSGVIARYHQNPDEFITHLTITGDHNQTVIGRNQTQAALNQTTAIETEREPVFKLLRQIEEALQADSSVGDEDKRQYQEDLRYIREQLKRREPNRSTLAAVLAPLSQVASLASNVTSLIRWLNS